MANRISGFFNKKQKEEKIGYPLEDEAAVFKPKKQDQAETRQVFPQQIVAGTGQSVGRHRDHNEDALFCLTSLEAEGKANGYFGLFIIADGMGGHRNGEIASSVASRAISRYLIRQILNDPSRILGDSSDEILHNFLDSAVAEAQKSVIQNAPGGGTTVTVALWTPEKVSIAQVGDSRAYFVLPEGKLQKITRDHSLVQRLLDLKEITEAEAETHPQKNVLLRAIGQTDPFKADISVVSVPEGAKLLLCSDGLWGVVDQQTIVDIVLREVDPIIACEQLVAEANQNGGPDNISVIVAWLKG